MKRNTSHTIKRAQRFPVILIGEGLLVGAVGGLIVLLYRIALTCAGKWLGEALAFIKGNPLRIAGWFAVLMLLAVLRDMGVDVKEDEDQIRIISDGRPDAVPLVKTLPYPGFPTDMQPLLMAAVLKARGSTVFNETIFENRFKHVGEFLRMGADVRIEGMNAIVNGVRRLHGAKVQAADLRGGAALAIAGLSAEGKTTLGGVEHIERGYVAIDKALTELGAKVAWEP